MTQCHKGGGGLRHVHVFFLQLNRRAADKKLNFDLHS